MMLRRTIIISSLCDVLINLKKVLTASILRLLIQKHRGVIIMQVKLLDTTKNYVDKSGLYYLGM